MVIVDRFLKWLSYTNFWVNLNKKFTSKFTFRWNGYPEFPMEKYFEMMKAIELDEAKNGPGIYAFVSCDHRSLSAIIIRFFSRAWWTHAGLLVGNHKILHMKATGAEHWHILEVLKESDYFAVGRVEIHPEALPIIGTKVDYILCNLPQFSYDFQLELDNDGKKLYCSELVYQLCGQYATNPEFRPKFELGRMVFEPDDLYKGMRIVFEHKG